jgi:15-cis-phytoene synthase
MIDIQQYCKEKAASSGSSFYYSFLFLPKNKQQAIMAVYAFCREVDDIVDNYKEKKIAENKLLWWKTEIDKIYTNHAEHPVGKALVEVVKEFDLPQSLFIQILDGMYMDLNYQGYQTFADLNLYCHCVASVVGLLAARIFGFSCDKTLEYAKNLGIAFQLVNIIRDVGEDARRGRIYIPEDELEKFSMSTDELLSLSIKNQDNFIELMKFQAARAREYYQKAVDLLPDQDRFSQKTGIIMAKIYFSILDEIEHSRFSVLRERVSITPLRKMWIAWKTNREEKQKQCQK